MLLLSLLLIACGGAPNEAPDRHTMPASGEAASSGKAEPAHDSASFDQMFIDMMVPHHQGGVEMAQIAQSRAEHAEIKEMAGAIIRSQEAEIGRMKGWRKAWFGSEDTPAMGAPMAHVDMSHAGMPDMAGMPGMPAMMDMPKAIEALKTATPFDLAFLDAMIPHHQGAVMMAKSCAEQAAHAEIKALAADIIRDQDKEIAQMHEWRKAWYPDAPTLAAAH